MSADWQRVWQAAEAARQEHGWSKADLYRRARISETSYASMRDGQALTRDDKRHAFASAFGWSPADLDRIARGGKPPRGAVPAAFLTGEGEQGHDGGELAELRAELAELRAKVGLLTELVGRLLDRVEGGGETVTEDR